VPAKVTKLIGLKRPPFLSPTNLIIFACTQNGEYGARHLNSLFWIIKGNEIDAVGLYMSFGVRQNPE
jgi:hypothetical protein